MSKSFAIKRLTQSDLTLFEPYFRKYGSSKQKAINLNANVFVEQLFPSLKVGAESGHQRIEAIVYLAGPGVFPKSKALNHKITKGENAKNWRLNGELIHEDIAGRFSSLEEEDIAIFEFEGSVKSLTIHLYLVSNALEEDQGAHQSLSRLLGGRPMYAFSAHEISSALSSVDLDEGHSLSGLRGYKIRPAARHMMTIGEGLIKDSFTALLELVKNSYDADASKVEIKLTKEVHGIDPSQNKITIEVSDDGHGMDFSTVVHSWMTPSIDDKLSRKTLSPKGRKMQGSKGIGRYAAMILGSELSLVTVKDGEETSAKINWDWFRRGGYLDEILIPISRKETRKPNGTTIYIEGQGQYAQDWSNENLENLQKELKKLLSPVSKEVPEVSTVFDKFAISVDLDGFATSIFDETHWDIEPIELLDYFDYRIWGEVDKYGNALFHFLIGALGKSHVEDISYKIRLNEKEGQFCGKLHIDLRIFNRDDDSIQRIIKQGFRDQPIGKREARKYLDDYSGIGIYRNGFRIRPYGDSGYDWLDLDKRRVDRPAEYLGSKQIIGQVSIEDEELSGLVERSSREGFKENQNYQGLISILKYILILVEERRIDYNVKTGINRSRKDLSRRIRDVFDFGVVNDEIKEAGIPDVSQKKIASILAQKSEEGNKLLDEIEKVIAIYQGQVTLGKIVEVVLHEARNPLGYIRTEAKNALAFLKKYQIGLQADDLEQVSNSIGGLEDQVRRLHDLFTKLEPLARRRNEIASSIDVSKIAIRSVEIMSPILAQNSVVVDIDFPAQMVYPGIERDFEATFINLIDNSVYWLSKSDDGIQPKEIKFVGKKTEDGLVIDFKDNGPGISSKFVSIQDIFEPGKSGKPGGTGLGLAIAGEAMERNGLVLSVLETEMGAHFRIESKKQAI